MHDQFSDSVTKPQLHWRGRCARGRVRSLLTVRVGPAAYDIEILKRELPIDILEFFSLTLLPGSEDHKKLHVAAGDIDPDLSKYDLEHASTDHPLISRQKWTEVYRDVFARYCTDSILRSCTGRWRASCGGVRAKDQEARHAIGDLLQDACASRARTRCGRVLQRKSRTQWRYRLPLVHPLILYPLAHLRFPDDGGALGLVAPASAPVVREN
jgi:hypothetical protein